MVKHHIFKLIAGLLVMKLFMVLTYGQCSQDKEVVFQPGEKIYYHAFYNLSFIWLDAGFVSFEVAADRWHGLAAYRLTSIGVTQRGYDRLFQVRDTFEVFLSPITHKPLEFKRITNEGSFFSSHHYWFNNETKTITACISKEGGPEERKEMKWPDCTFDVLSMIYHARNIDFLKYKPGDRIPISLLVDGEIYPLYIRYLGEEVVMDRQGQKFNCLKFKPLLVDGTIFQAGEDMTVWVTNDRNRVPIIVEAKILIGSVKAIMSGYEGLKFPLSAKIK
jgi:hypothetical protein